MAQLKFFFGTMGSGKSTQALQVHHNLRARGLDCLLVTQMDRTEGKVSSRLGVAADATIIDHTIDLRRFVHQHHMLGSGLHAVICDESQFYSPGQIDQLARIVDELDIEVYAYGLLTSFQGLLFPATKRLLELADVRNELQVEARCWCGERATHNARLVNGMQVYDGDLVAVGDTEPADGDDAPVITYDLMCRRHWLEGLNRSAQDSLFPEIDLDNVTIEL